MMRRMMLVALGLTAVAVVTALNAQEAGQPSPQPKQGTDISKAKDKITLEEKKLAEKFNVFLQQLTVLKDRLEKGTPEDQKYAQMLEKVIQQTKNKSIDVQFQQMVDFLKKDDLKNLKGAQEAHDMSKKLTAELQTLLDLLRQDKSLADLQNDIQKYKAILEKVEAIIAQQKFVQGATKNLEVTKADPASVGKEQAHVEKKLDNLGKAIDGKADGKGGDDGKGSQGEITKSSPKPGDGKSGDNDSQAKGDNDPGKGKGGDKGDNSGQKGPDGQAKGGDSDGKGGDKNDQGKGKDGGQGGDKASDGQAKGGDKSGDQSGGKGGDKNAQGGDKSGQQGGAKGGDKAGQGGDKSGSKSGGDKAGGGDPKAGGQGDQKGGSKGGDPKGGGQGGAKGGDKAGSPMNPNDKGGDKGAQKAGSQGNQGQAKGDQKGSQGGSKAGGGDPKSGGGDPKGGGQGGAKGDGGGQGGGDPKGGGGDPSGGGKGGDKKDNDGQIKKQIQDADHYAKKAEDNLKKDQDPQKAGDNQKEVLDKLGEAKKKLEDILKQLREEEIERLLADLAKRVEHMLVMQTAVRDQTVNIADSIKKNKGKTETLHKKQAQDESNKEKDIINEATKAIEMLEADGSAIAFPEVFRQVREDMKSIANYLDNAKVDEVTVVTENDVIATLQEMLDALKEAQKDMKNKKKKSPPGSPGGSGKKPDEKLMKLVQELKMIKSQQLKINNRTNLFGKMIKGEQAGDPAIQKQLQDLSERQEKLFDATKKLSKGDNQ